MMNREAKQRRITGNGEEPYLWKDRPERRPTRRPSRPVRHYAPEPPREISSQRKRINAIYEENKTLTAEIEGLEVQLCMETRPSIIKQKAGTIGMITPAENEVCVLRTVVRRTTDTAQTAESGTRAR